MNALENAPGTNARDLVYGVGNTGLSVARCLEREGREAVFVDTRRSPPGIDELRRLLPSAEIVLGERARTLPAGVRRIIASPGISDRDPLLTAARAAGIEVLSDIALFVERAPVPFVAVTGSNGKSTVTTLLALMCNAAGVKALAGANLGEPALDLLLRPTPELFVLELSSFQLQRTPRLPAKVAVLLNISADHLDWHRDEAEYREAKYRVLREADAVVINRGDAAARERVSAGQTCRSFALDEPRRRNYGVREQHGKTFLCCGDEPLLDASELSLVGRHNRENALAALAAGDLLGLPRAAMLGVLQTFPGLPHRMQLVRQIGNTRYIDDSKATNVAAAIASVLSLEGRVVLIAGGQGKGGDFAALADAVADRLRAAVLIGEDAGRIAAAFGERVPVHRAESLEAAVIAAAGLAEAGDTVLLAPACASFDQFDNYMQRGNVFRAAAEGLPA